MVTVVKTYSPSWLTEICMGPMFEGSVLMVGRYTKVGFLPTMPWLKL